MLSPRTVQPKRTLTKLETFLKEFAQPPAHNQPSLKNAEKTLDNINQSPVAATVNVFENEDSILNILNRTGSTTEKSTDYYMGNFQNRRNASKSITTKRKTNIKRKTTSKLSSKSVRSQYSKTLVSSPESETRSRKYMFSYFKKNKSINNSSTKKNVSTNTIESISIVNSFSDRTTVTSNYEIVDISDEEPVTDWERIRWMFGIENNPPLKETNQNSKNNNKTKQIDSSEDDMYSSPLFKGLDFIREYSKEYIEKVDKIKHICGERRRKTSLCSSKSKTIEQPHCHKLEKANNNRKQKYKDYSGDFRKTLSKSCIRGINRYKSVSEKSFTRKSSCHIAKSTHKSQFIQKTYSRISNTKIYNSGKTTITDYFSKRKLTHRDRETGDDSPKSKQTVCNIFDKDYILSLDSKERAKQFNFNEKTVKNTAKDQQNTEPIRNVNDTVTKTQKNLFSSEGFFESLSNESLIQNDSKSKNADTYHYDIKDKDSQNVFQSSLKNLPENTITLNKKREQSPEYYVMKITGPESKAFIEKMLNSDENTQVSSISIKKKDDNLKHTNFDVETETLIKNTLSNHLSFGSPILTYSGNTKRNINGAVKKNVEEKTNLGTNKLTQSIFAKNAQSLVCNSPGLSSFPKESLVIDKCTPGKPRTSQLTQTIRNKDNRFKELSNTKFHETNNCSSENLINKQNSKKSQEFTLSQSTSQNVQKCLSQMQSNTVNESELNNSGSSQDILDQLNRNSTISPIVIKGGNLKENTLQKLHESNNWSLQNLTNKPNLKNIPELSASQNYQKSLKTLKNTDLSQTQSHTAFKSSSNNQDISDQLNKNSLISPIDIKNTNLKEISKNNNILGNHSQSKNRTENPIFGNIFTQNFLNILNKKCEEHQVYTGRTRRKDNEELKSVKEIENKQIQESCNNENSEIETAGEYSQTNFEYFKTFVNTQTENTLTESEVPSQSINKKLKKTYNITNDCILHEDNLLKTLLEDKNKPPKKSRKTVSKRKNSEELVENCSKVYIKRYKKGNTKIFQIRKRKKINGEEEYKPSEGQIMDRFLEKATNDFLNETHSDLIDHQEESSVSTPTSYITDDTKSECLSTGSSKLAQPQKLLRQGINKLSKDKSLLFVKSMDTLPKEFDKDEILENIDRILGNVLEDFNQGRPAAFKIPKEHITNCVFEDQRFQIKDPPEYTTVSYKAIASRPKFNLILFLLNKIKMLLESNTKLTKREIYYQLKTMINSQSTTDQALKDVSRMLNVGLWALNVIAQKGLVYGNLKLVMADGETVNCNVPGTLIPQDISKICEVHSSAYFILVVEKESIFHKLLEENLPNRLTRPFILMTGKGFPDLNTQLFLKKLWMVMSIPVFILVDADPDGIAIMLNYRFGSIANAHVSAHLAIPKARWVGVFPSEILKLSLSYENLSKREIAKTQTLLQLPCVQANEKIKSQLEKLLENGLKTGIEGLVKTDTYLSNFYLNWKFYTNDLI